jgi:phage FluMu gp28-like protein
VSTAANPLNALNTSALADEPPPVMLAYQQAWIADEAQLKVCEKGRRVGLTWAEAADAVLIAASEGGTNYFYISATQDMAREFVEAAAMWTRAFNYAAGEMGEGLYDDGADVADSNRRFIKTYEISYPHTGRRIVALSSRPTNLRGKQGVVGIDEAAFAPELGGLLKAAMAMLLWGDKVRIWSTHDGVENAFAQLVDEVRAGKRGGPRVASVHRVAFGDAVAAGLYQRVCLRKGKTWSQPDEDAWVAAAYRFYGEDAPEELDVVPSSSAGKYLSLALIGQRMTAVPAPVGPHLVRGRWDDAFAYLGEDVRTYAIKGWIAEHLAPMLAALNPLRRHVFGQDFARSLDLSVITVLEEDVDLVHRVKLVVELGNCPFSCQEQILFAIVDALKSRRFRGGAMDATGNGASLAEKAAQRYGVEMIEQVKLSVAFYLAHMPKLKAGLQDGTLTDIPRDEHLQTDLRAIALVSGVPMLPKTNTASAAARAEAAEGGTGKHGRRHGDFAISLFMAEYAFHREAGEIDFTPAPGRSHRQEAPQGRGFQMRASDADDDLRMGEYEGDGGF